MTVSTKPTPPSVEVTADAREALLAHVREDPARRPFVRIHVGRG
jgi:hypothetical protein